MLISFFVILLIIVPVVALPSGLPTDGLVAYYSFDDGTAHDNSGNGKDGTIVGASSVTGFRGQGLQFDGTNDLVTLPFLFTSDPGQITMMAFIKPDTSDIFDQRLVFYNGNYECLISITPKNSEFVDISTGVKLNNERYTSIWHGATTSLPKGSGSWYHVTGVIDTDLHKIRIYIDGILKNETSLPVDTFNTPSGYYVAIGAFDTTPYGRTYFYKGVMDEVLVYRRALTSNEIYSLYQSYFPQPTPTAVQTTDVVTLYPGWNFVSTPKTLADGKNTAGYVFGSVNVAAHSIFSYNALNKNWEVITSTTVIKPLEGIWIYSQNTANVVLNYNTNPLAPPPTKQLYLGWNAIGSGENQQLTAQNTLLTIQNTWAKLIGFDASSQSYDPTIFNSNPSYQSTVYPKRGYWIFMSSDGVYS
jgi:hypothetical protein